MTSKGAQSVTGRVLVTDAGLGTGVATRVWPPSPHPCDITILVGSELAKKDSE